MVLKPYPFSKFINFTTLSNFHTMTTKYEQISSSLFIKNRKKFRKNAA